MSKAFTQESDGGEEFFMPPPLPPGVKNYITPGGAARLATEIKKLQEEKSLLSASDVAARARREKIDAQLSYLVPRFDAVHVIDPSLQPKDRVLFGARFTLRDGAGAQEVWRIVGLDEMDLDRGDLSWMSPLAMALLDKKSGDTVAFRGRALTLLKIDYPAGDGKITE